MRSFFLSECEGPHTKADGLSNGGFFFFFKPESTGEVGGAGRTRRLANQINQQVIFLGRLIGWFGCWKSMQGGATSWRGKKKKEKKKKIK